VERLDLLSCVFSLESPRDWDCDTCQFHVLFGSGKDMLILYIGGSSFF